MKFQPDEPSSGPNVMGLTFKPTDARYLLPNEANSKFLDLQYHDDHEDASSVMAQSSERLLMELVSPNSQQEACPSDLNITNLDDYDFYNPSYGLKYRKNICEK